MEIYQTFKMLIYQSFKVNIIAGESLWEVYMNVYVCVFIYVYGYLLEGKIFSSADSNWSLIMFLS